jgi:hypothetical protein
MNLFIILVALSVILVPSFALISSSQSNDTLSNEALSDDANDASNQTFASISRELAENQSGSDGDSNEDND